MGYKVTESQIDDWREIYDCHNASPSSDKVAAVKAIAGITGSSLLEAKLFCESGYHCDGDKWILENQYTLHMLLDKLLEVAEIIQQLKDRGLL